MELIIVIGSNSITLSTFKKVWKRKADAGLKILRRIDYSSISHWMSDIINDLSTDYPSITHWLLIDFIDVIH